jgi:glycine cleavage system aminomethyltransferase T
MACGQVAYTLACRDDASVLNDATVWRRATDHYTLFTGRRADWAHVLECGNGLDVVLSDVSSARATCAVQGPAASRVLRSAMPEHAWETLRYFHFRTVDFAGVTCDVARLGYSGEAGFELVAAAHAAPALWRRLAAAGAPLGLTECGFAAADALRIEAGFILFSRELVQRVTPFEINLGHFVSRTNPRCIGADALTRARGQPPARCLVGLVIEGDAAPEVALREATAGPGQAVLTSACLSPLYRRWIGLGFVTPEDRTPGTRVALEGARRATVARLPFYDPMKVRPRREWNGAPALAKGVSA